MNNIPPAVVRYGFGTRNAIPETIKLDGQSNTVPS
jgi:hypothetical protein